jgi:uncharacterized protein (DUF169 family)
MIEEDNMESNQGKYSILDRFDFERKPVGIKYLLNKPAGIEKLDKSLTFCQMFKEAQGRRPFYAVKENFSCAGPLLLGMRQPDPVAMSGQIGAADGIFKEARANRRIYQQIPRLERDTVRYVAFSPVDELSFDPDVVIFTTNPSQAEILLRALCYSTGRILTTRTTPAVLCSWLFVYPYVSGESNYSITGLGFGMKARRVLPEGLILISIPYDLLSMTIENLKEMDWVLGAYSAGEEEIMDFFMKTGEGVRQEYENG